MASVRQNLSISTTLKILFNHILIKKQKLHLASVSLIYYSTIFRINCLLKKSPAGKYIVKPAYINSDPE